MPSILSFTFTLALATLAATQTASTTSMYLWDYGGKDITATVLNSEAGATTYTVPCSDEKTCDFSPGMTLITGASTAGIKAHSGSLSATNDCKITSNTGVCTVVANTADAAVTTTVTVDNMSAMMATSQVAVTIASATQSALGVAKETNVVLAGIAGALGIAMAL